MPSQAIQTVGWRNGYPKRNKTQNPSPLDIAPLSPFKPNATIATCNAGFALLFKSYLHLKSSQCPAFLSTNIRAKPFPWCSRLTVGGHADAWTTTANSKQHGSTSPNVWGEGGVFILSPTQIIHIACPLCRLPHKCSNDRTRNQFHTNLCELRACALTGSNQTHPMGKQITVRRDAHKISTHFRRAKS